MIQEFSQLNYYRTTINQIIRKKNQYYCNENNDKITCNSSRCIKLLISDGILPVIPQRQIHNRLKEVSEHISKDIDPVKPFNSNLKKIILIQ